MKRILYLLSSIEKGLFDGSSDVGWLTLLVWILAYESVSSNM